MRVTTVACVTEQSIINSIFFYFFNENNYYERSLRHHSPHYTPSLYLCYTHIKNKLQNAT